VEIKDEEDKPKKDKKKRRKLKMFQMSLNYKTRPSLFG